MLRFRLFASYFRVLFSSFAVVYARHSRHSLILTLIRVFMIAFLLAL